MAVLMKDDPSDATTTQGVQMGDLLGKDGIKSVIKHFFIMKCIPDTVQLQNYCQFL